MPKMEISGLEDLNTVLSNLDKKTEDALKMAVYDGAHEVFEEVKRQIAALPEGDSKSKHRDITAKQKQGLLSGIYGSKIRTTEGGIFEHISFTGYNNVKTAKYPNGQPNVLIARSIESGSSYMNKHAFMSKARTASRVKALAATKRTFDAEINKITKE